MNSPAAPAGFARRFMPLWGIGIVGVLGLLLQQPPASLLNQAPQLRDLAPAALQALLLVNPMALVTVSALVGAAVAHRVQLRSRLAGDVRAQMAPGIALIAGLLLAAALVSIDAALAESLGNQWLALLAQTNAAPRLHALAIGVLYGGLAEEVMMRWGVMSLVAWLLWTGQKRLSVVSSQPSEAVMWASIAFAALVFALGHLPSLAQSITLTGPVVARTVLLNLLAGVTYGWLFWRKGLECAMLAHAVTHLGLAAARAMSQLTASA